MEYLAWYERARTLVLDYWNYTKSKAREWLGPEPQQWHLLPDGRIVPSCVRLPRTIQSVTYWYDPHTHRLSQYGAVEGRYRPLPFISMKFENEIVGSIDISDWIGDLRVNPVSNTLTPLQLATLWSLVTSQYVPIRNVTVSWTNRDGEEITETY